MGRLNTRPAPKSGAALRFEQQRRAATEALRAQAAQVREIRAAQAAPPLAVGEGEVHAAQKAGKLRPVRRVEKLAKASPEPALAKIAPIREAGAYPIADLREGQCRFACTPHTARPAEHRFCGEPVAWKGGKPTSWCREHLPVVSGAPGRHAGGASVADVEALEAAKGA